MTVEVDPGAVGEVIRQQRHRRGISQAELGRLAAQALGRARAFGEQTVAAWERGRRQPDVDTLTAIGAALGVTFALVAGAARAVREAHERRESEAVDSAARAEEEARPKSERPVPR